MLGLAVSSNFSRRDRALRDISEMRATCVQLCWMHRDWDHSPRRVSGANALALCTEFLANVRNFLIAPETTWRTYNQPGGPDAHAMNFYARALRCLSTLCVLQERLGAAAGFTRGGLESSGLARHAQYVRKLGCQLESLRLLREYNGSPHGLRFFVAFMAIASPALLAPYFRSFCAAEDSHALAEHGSGSGCAPGFFACALYCTVLSTLYDCHAEIENMTDGHGLDDIFFNLDEELPAAAAAAPFELDPDSGVVELHYCDELGSAPLARAARVERRLPNRERPGRRMSVKIGKRLRTPLAQ